MGWLLGNRAFVWLGTRSYGLYLYHWPIFQGIRRVAGNTLSVPQFVLGSAAAILVAELSYRFIESPVRRRLSCAGRGGERSARGRSPDGERWPAPWRWSSGRSASPG